MSRIIDLARVNELLARLASRLQAPEARARFETHILQRIAAEGPDRSLVKIEEAPSQTLADADKNMADKTDKH